MPYFEMSSHACDLKVAGYRDLALPALYAQNDWPSYGHDPGGQRYRP